MLENKRLTHQDSKFNLTAMSLTPSEGQTIGKTGEEKARIKARVRRKLSKQEIVIKIIEYLINTP